jgi:hypothetical protein
MNTPSCGYFWMNNPKEWVPKTEYAKLSPKAVMSIVESVLAIHIYHTRKAFPSSIMYCLKYGQLV